MNPLTSIDQVGRRRFLARALVLAAMIGVPALAQSQDATPGMKRRQDRRDDRNERIQQRDQKMVERRSDPIGVRGPQRREDRRSLRNDRRVDRRERVL